jgi:hypothetical protein
MLAPTIEELRSIALGASDASGYFPAMYAQVTDRIRRAAAEGEFDDAARMERFAMTFAAWFTRARADAATAPRCWKASFDVADDDRLMIVQHLLLGINAHVNHDLPQAVVELAGDGDVAALKPDFMAVNEILADTLPDVLRCLGTVSKWVNLVAARGGKAFDFSLRVARDQAWRAAERLHGLDPPQRPAAAHELDDVVSVLAYLVAHQKPPGAWAVWLGRRLESNDPAAVTRALLGPLA